MRFGLYAYLFLLLIWPHTLLLAWIGLIWLNIGTGGGLV
jgi:hypothetical protein